LLWTNATHKLARSVSTGRRSSPGIDADQVSRLLGEPTKKLRPDGRSAWYHSYPTLGNDSVFFTDAGRVLSRQSPVGWCRSQEILDVDSARATEMLQGKTVARVIRHRPGEVVIEFADGTRVFVDRLEAGLELSIT